MGGKPSVPQTTAQDRAILDLKLQRDKLKQYQKQIQGTLDREQEIAKQHLVAGRKDHALLALRHRKYQQGLLQKTDAQMESLQQLVSTVEFALVEVSVLHGLKQGNEVLKEIHKEMNVETVEQLLEETREAQEYQREIDTMLGNNLSLDEEDAVQAELHELETEAELGRERVTLPSAPSTEPSTVDKVEAEPQHEKEGARQREAIPA